MGSGEDGMAPTPGAARTVGSLAVLQAPLTVASVLRQPGHPGAAGRGVAAAAEAGGEPALLPQLSQGKSRPGQEAAGGQWTIIPQGHGTLGVGGRRDRGAVGGWQQPPLAGGSSVSHGPGDTPSLSHFCCNWGEVGLGEGDRQPGCAGWWVGGMPEGTLGGLGGDSSTVPSTGSQAPRCGAGWPLGSH